MKKPWKQELVWVQRNEQGVAVGISEKLPEGVDFVPTMQPSKIHYIGKPKKDLDGVGAVQV